MTSQGHNHTREVAVGLAVTGLLLAGCSSSKGSAAATPTTTSPAASSAPPAATSAPPPATSVAPATTASVAVPSPPAPTAPATTASVPVVATTTVAPSTTVAAPTAAADHKYDKDPAVQAWFAWTVADTQAGRVYRGDYPPLVALSTNNRLSFDVALLAQYKKAGYVLKGETVSVVLALSSANATDKSLQVCQSNSSGGWVDKSGKAVHKVAAAWSPVLAVMKLVGTAWRVDGAYAGTFSCKGLA